MEKNHPHNALSRFIFDRSPIRGGIIQLNQTYHDVLQHQHLPTVIKIALGELMAASALLSASLKMDGTLILQIQSKGPLKLLVVECNSALEIRATAKWSEPLDETADFISLVSEGHCMITLDPTDGEAYQGIVPIEGDSIADMLSYYMLQSQQIDTKLWLTCNGESAAGMLIQKLPDAPMQDADAWNRVGMLADTVANEELQTLAPDVLLTRLFNEEEVRLFAPTRTQFKCRCNRKNVANMLHMLGEAEVNSVIAELGKVDVNCDFCNQQYQFDALDVAALFASNVADINSDLAH